MKGQNRSASNLAFFAESKTDSKTGKETLWRASVFVLVIILILLKIFIGPFYWIKYGSSRFHKNGPFKPLYAWALKAQLK